MLVLAPRGGDAMPLLSRPPAIISNSQNRSNFVDDDAFRLCCPGQRIHAMEMERAIPEGAEGTEMAQVVVETSGAVADTAIV